MCVSDTHSRTDGIQMPYGDVLLHTGDFTELGLPSEVKKFNDWLGTKQLNIYINLHTTAHTHHLNTHTLLTHATCNRQGEGPEAQDTSPVYPVTYSYTFYSP